MSLKETYNVQQKGGYVRATNLLYYYYNVHLKLKPQFRHNQ